ncbi:MAG TPA: acyl-ACP--UDP-N-acetylglucosamine O-acyltransferase [Methylomirabilota bacterium]|jgi:UDP-N-acetylglucosamine acyltransferase
MTPDGIHASAIVDPHAVLGRDVRVGAFSIIGPDVSLADGVEVGHHVILEGRIDVGPLVQIGHGSALGGRPQDLKFKEGTPSGIRIGAETVIREYVVIHRASRPEGMTEIGPKCLIMSMSHVAHDCRIGQGVIIINYAGITGHCQIGDYATIGGLSGLAPFVRVGQYAYLGGSSRVTVDVPPFMLAFGAPPAVHSVNVVGLRRAGIPPADRRAVQDAHRILYRSGLTPVRAVERMRQELSPHPLVDALVEFVASASHRGICGPPGGWGQAAVAGEELETGAEHGGMP